MKDYVTELKNEIAERFDLTPKNRKKSTVCVSLNFFFFFFFFFFVGYNFGIIRELLFYLETIYCVYS